MADRRLPKREIQLNGVNSEKTTDPRYPRRERALRVAYATRRRARARECILSKKRYVDERVIPSTRELPSIVSRRARGNWELASILMRDDDFPAFLRGENEAAWCRARSPVINEMISIRAFTLRGE